MTRQSNRASIQPLCFTLRSIFLPLHSKLSGKHFAAMSPTLTKNGAQKRAHQPIPPHTHVLNFHVREDGIKQPRRLADVGRHKTSESVNRNQRKKDRVSELTWKYTISARRPFVSGNSFSQGSGTSATRSRFLYSQKESAEHSVLIFQPSKKDSLKKRAGQGGPS